ncbi:hypothetical protein BXZ70DRAFT_971907, partial [Cristinia sonorae]
MVSVMLRLTTPTTLVGDEIDPLTRLSLDVFLSTTNSSQQTYNEIRDGLLRYDPKLSILSLDQVKRLLPQLTGVVPIQHDMCPKSCMAYTGPFSNE